MVIQHRGLGVISHAHRPELVNDPSTRVNSVGQASGWRSIAQEGSSRSLNDRTKCFLHVFGHFDFIVTPCPMEPQHRDAPFVAYLRIDLAVAIWIRNHLPTARKSNERAVVGATLLLQRRTITLVFFADAGELAYARHVPASAELDVITAQEVILAVVFPPWHIQVHATRAVMVVRGEVF